MEMTRGNKGNLGQLMAHHFKSLRNVIIGAGALMILSVLPFAALVIGALKINECPIQRMIPVWLIVVGAIGVTGCALLTGLLFCQICCYSRYNSNNTDAPLMSCFYCTACLMGTFYLAWMIVGCVWIFSVKSDVQFDDSTAGSYCHKSTYNYAFGLVIVQLCLGGIFECFLGCGIIFTIWEKYSE